MAPTLQNEIDIRAFAREFDTPEVRRMVALCESGRIAWAEAAVIARRALGVALTEVGA